MIEIELRGIEGFGYHGCYPEERHDGQVFVVDVTLGLSDCCETDNLSETVNYAEVAKLVADQIAGDPVNLIETLAARIGDALVEIPRVRYAEVKVHKPQAPIGVSVAGISVSRTAYRPQVVLALGSNRGGRLANLEQALRRISEIPGLDLHQVSDVYETEPWGVADQPRFFNAAVSADFFRTPQELLVETRAIEDHMGRDRSVRWGPRTIDIDIVAIGEMKLQTTELTLPHPRAVERSFVVIPWLDVDPDAVLNGQRVSSLPVAGEHLPKVAYHQWSNEGRSRWVREEDSPW